MVGRSLGHALEIALLAASRRAIRAASCASTAEHVITLLVREVSCAPSVAEADGRLPLAPVSRGGEHESMPDALNTVAAPPEPCARCGGDSDFEIASLWLCIDCYHIAGSTCAGVGRIPATASSSGTSPDPGASAVLDQPDQVC
jgi:hypothetical protein